jgi:hypothetical protein
MTKKDFISLADHIRSNRGTFTNEAVASLAYFLQIQYPAFKASHWLGYILGTNGPNGGTIKN